MVSEKLKVKSEKVVSVLKGKFRLMLAAGAVFAALPVMADAILWMVDDSVYDGAEFTAARVMVTPTGADDRSDGIVLSAVYFNEDTYGYTDVYPDGIGVMGGDTGIIGGQEVLLSDTKTTGDMWSLIGSDINKTTARFYIELGNYELGNSGDELVWTGTVAQSQDLRSYDWLRGNGSLGTGGDFDNVYHAWDGGPYEAVPEPTSGMLVMLGLAVAALRRKRI